ncbi:MULTISPECIES: MEDS domain-containing protein [Halorussus]|uniref:MEDS domain-containing protein n=1 Tax=Halorussus TaxID=1070314 RepID=UPI000E219E21|nr:MULTISPECIES: MEDS domain-containing protein [Halorussus]NHN61122.1 histidine kinase [Halorussus sp. JP-T4]
MSEHPPPVAGAPLEPGLEALETSPEFRGPVERLDGHHCNDHFAQIYETDEERFAAAVPFARHGLESGECVMYVVDEGREAEVRAALGRGGVDVDAAVDSGALSLHTPRETYLRNGSFEPDEMVEFYGDTVAAADAEYEGLRIVAETSWLDGDRITYEQFMEYEAKVNRLFDAENCVALCQYDRTRFPPEFVRNIVRSHPHLIHDGAVSHNVYYTPPAEVFDDDPAREVDRMLGTLRERTEAKAQLQRRDRFLRELYEIAAGQDRSFEEKLDALFELGCEVFDLNFGFLNRVDSAADRIKIEYASDDHEHYEVGGELPLSETYCKAAVDIEAAASIADPAAEGYDDLFVYEELGVDGYFGTYIPVDGGADRTLAFVPAPDSESVSVSEEDRMHLELMGQWVGYELNRRQREQFLRECHEITSDPDHGFEAKLERLVELGCDRFGLDAGGLCRVNRESDFLEVETVIGDHDVLEPGLQADLSETYCQVPTATGAVADAAVSDPDGVTDPGPFEGTLGYEVFGIRTYLGTHLELDGAPNRTFWLVSNEPRDDPITDEERTFHRLMGQWVKYELERQQREQYQRELYEIAADPDRSFEAKLDALFDLGRERFGLDVGGIAKIDPETDLFEVEAVRGDHDHLIPGERYPLSETYCRLVTEDGETAAVTDPVDVGFEGQLCYDRFGVQTYLGNHLAVEGGTDRTFWFASTEPREAPITDEERTFVHLMGQWVKYELERRQRERQLERKNDRLESFASLLAHELRNPVTIGQIYGQQLEGEADPEAVEYVLEAFDRIEDMVDVLLILTRGREAVGECAPVDLAAAARDVWETVEAPDAALDVDLDRPMEADETYVSHLFRNLLENSVEHGGADVTVTVGDLGDGFYVADDGVGIPVEDREAVFDEGYTTAADNGGTGLGLAFVRKLAEVYEWDVSVTESESGGARFEFRNVD